VPLVVRPDWSDFYPGVKEELPPHMPEPLGKSVQTICFVNADHAGDRVSRRSRTGYLIFLNRALIDWFSKKQKNETPGCVTNWEGHNGPSMTVMQSLRTRSTGSTWN
jgi:hypothetical protein